MNAEENIRSLELELRAAKKLHSRGGYNWRNGTHDGEACYRFILKKNALIGVYERLVRAQAKLISQNKKGN